MSILGKTWTLKYERKENESLWSALLNARQISDPGKFFSSASTNDLLDPFLFPEMAKAVERIKAAINARERIIVYGDYDVDGTSGAAILIHTLRFLSAEVSYRIPHRREDGYGLHKKYVDEMQKNSVSLIITVDCGISCSSEIDYANTLKIDTIITDHHTIPENLPKAFAILHPKLAKNYPFDELSGSGVAFKLASALLIDSGNDDLIPTLSDLASLGTVADCVPLTGENRTIVKLGLQQMKNTKWDGLRSILETAGAWEKQEFTSETIGFQIGPRINASGRIDNPYWALQALISEGEEARQKSLKLDELNRERQTLTKQIFEEAKAVIDDSSPTIIAEGVGWSSGVVGLIAGKLLEKFNKPTFILEDRDDFLVGSARSLPGFHAVKALQSVADLLESYGGHELAAGFHLKKENFKTFKSRLNNYAEEQFQKTPITSTLDIDIKLNPDEINLENCNKISTFAPFGIGNEQPNFLLENIDIIKTKSIGRHREHIKFSFRSKAGIFDGIAFNFARFEEALTHAKSIIVNLENNEWDGKNRPQLKLIDFRT